MRHPKRLPIEPGQESVWDYPRPPRLEREARLLRIVHRGVTIAQSAECFRVLETSHPPTYYFPPDDITEGVLEPCPGSSFCEFKGLATYANVVVVGHKLTKVAWRYPTPTSNFKAIRDYVAFYPSPFDACFVGDQQAKAQDGDFYGGWITAEIVGPFKGSPGSYGW